MAGHVIAKYLKSRGIVVDCAARTNEIIYINVEKPETIDRALDHDYDYVINCIGLLVKDSNNNPHQAALINSWFPHYLEYKLLNKKTKLIHLSTDCVFNGIKGNYIETDIHDETNYYGKSKSLGEVNNSKDITFRMSIIGPELKPNGTGLLHWVTTNKESTLPGWSNAWWNGITTLQLAKSIITYMYNPSISGVYHLVPNKNIINKFELVSLINDVYKLGKTVVETQGPKDINKILIDTRKEFNFNIPNYRIMLEEMRDFML